MILVELQYFPSINYFINSLAVSGRLDSAKYYTKVLKNKYPNSHNCCIYHLLHFGSIGYGRRYYSPWHYGNNDS